jgi:hypothetical protein
VTPDTVGSGASGVVPSSPVVDGFWAAVPRTPEGDENDAISDLVLVLVLVSRPSRSTRALRTTLSSFLRRSLETLAARWIRETHRDYFLHKEAEPFVDVSELSSSLSGVSSVRF